MDYSWVALVVAALIVGISKTSFVGLSSVAVTLLAFVLPTRESTAAALLLFMTGDIVAVIRYRSNADWGLLRGLLPAVLPGLLLGAFFLSVVDDLVLRRSIGAILLISVLIQLTLKLRSRGREPQDTSRPPLPLTIGAGVAAGFTTMAANAAAPVMALYLQLSKVEKLRFLGTAAWFYFIVNLSKTPLTASLGLFTPQVLRTAALLVPAVLVGTTLGAMLIGHVKQRAFDVFTLLTSVIAAGALLVF